MTDIPVRKQGGLPTWAWVVIALIAIAILIVILQAVL